MLPRGSSCVQCVVVQRARAHAAATASQGSHCIVASRHDNEIRVLKLRGETPAGGLANQDTLPTCRLLSHGSHINSVDRSLEKDLLNAEQRFSLSPLACLVELVRVRGVVFPPQANNSKAGPVAKLRLGATVAFTYFQATENAALSLDDAANV